MPVLLTIIPILFAIGLLLVKDPSKLPPFLQIIRKGLVAAKIIIIPAIILGIAFVAFMAWAMYKDNQDRNAYKAQQKAYWIAEQEKIKEFSPIGEWAWKASERALGGDVILNIYSDNTFLVDSKVEGKWKYNPETGELKLNYINKTELLKITSINGDKVILEGDDELIKR